MTQRTGDGLSQRVFLRGQSAIIPANFLLRKMSGHRLVEDARVPSSSPNVPWKIALPP
jgi:hypothetical protein